ncbi:unnamed protein product, partial [Closterium sp. NIES-54]
DIGSPLNMAVASVITAVAAASTALALDEVFCVPQPPLHLIADAFGQMAKNRRATALLLPTTASSPPAVSSASTPSSSSSSSL